VAINGGRDQRLLPVHRDIHFGDLHHFAGIACRRGAGPGQQHAAEQGAAEK
jgi:hypothetical protein